MEFENFEDVDEKVNPFFPGCAYNTLNGTGIIYPDASQSVTDEEIFNTAWTELMEIVQNEIVHGRKRKGVKRKSKAMYDGIIEGLKTHSTSCGFSNEELQEIWKVVSHPLTNINCTQRRKMILLMTPKRKVSDDVIKRIVFWLKDACSRGFKPTVIVGVFQLLTLYADHRLVEDSGIMNETILTRVLSTQTENFGIPWKMRLFKSIATPEILTGPHIKELNELMVIQGAKNSHIAHVDAALEMCKRMRPELVMEEKRMKNMRPLSIPQEALVLFYQCRARIQNEIKDELHPMANKIFPEFLPNAFQSGRFVRKTLTEEMLACLDTEKGTVKLTVTPKLWQLFEEWIKPIIHQRFHCFSGFGAMEDYERYNFLFDRCITIGYVRQMGLPTLNRWIGRFLYVWDFWTFKKTMVELIPYIKPKDILGNKQNLHEIIVNRFTHCTWLRCCVWNVLEELFLTWIVKLNANHDSEELQNGLLWLLNLMNVCVTSLVLTSQYATKSSFLLTQICQFYDMIPKYCSTFQNLGYDLRNKMLQLPEALLPAIIVNDCLENYSLLLKCVTNRMELLNDYGLENNTDALSLGLNSVFVRTFKFLFSNFTPEHSLNTDNFLLTKAQDLASEWFDKNEHGINHIKTDMDFKFGCGEALVPC